MKRIDCDYLGHQFHVYDYDSSHSPELILQDLRKGMYALENLKVVNGPILDIGANIGILTILFAKMFPNLHIYAIEPLEHSVNCLQTALIENNIKNVSVHMCAVGGENKTIRAVAGHGMSGGASCVDPERSLFEVVHHNLTSMLTPQELFTKLGLSKFGLLKIDCEGGEYGFFERMTDEEIRDSFELMIGEFHYWQGAALDKRIRSIIGDKLTVNFA